MVHTVLMNSPKELTRRDFLRDAGAATIGATIPSFLQFAFNEPKAYAVKVKEGMTWGDGFENMKRDVYNSPVETTAWYTEGEKPMWRIPHDLGVDRGTLKDVARDEVFAAGLVHEKPHKAVKAHAHTFATLVDTKHVGEDLKWRVMRGEVLPPLAPPSVPDVYYHVWMTRQWFEPAVIPFEDIVFDPSGVWRMTLRAGHFSKTLFDYFTIDKITLPKAIEHSSLSIDERKEIAECIKKLNSACVQKHNSAEINRLFESYRSLRYTLDEHFFPSLFRYSGTIIKMQEESAYFSQRERREYITKIIEIARELDINLSFEPYATPYTE